ncbi:MAG: hypothetical protein J6P19_05140, partial [Acetobacter sp.]|nr:hypothetical protein [Acetobacter sp.]
VEKLVQYNSQLLDRVLDQQKTFYEDLKGEHARTRKEMHARFDETQEKTLKAIDAEGIRGLKDKLNMLLAEYKAFQVILQGKKPFLRRDLEKLEETAKELMGMFETRYQDQPVGSPARLPFFLGMAFCLGVWCDARSALGDLLDHCFARAHALIDGVNAELRAITQNASLYALAVGEKDVINQYVALTQSLRALSSLSRSKADEIVLLALPGWDDGLQKIRELVCASQEKGQKTPMPALTLENAEEREAWRKIAKLPETSYVDKVSGEEIHHALGIPDDVSLTPSEARKLLDIAPALLEQNNMAVRKQISGSV